MGFDGRVGRRCGRGLQAAQVTIARVNWSDDAETKLSRALPGIDRAIIRAEVERGVSILWHCRDERHEAYCVTRLDHNPANWVIVAYEGSGMQHFGPLFLEAAKRAGVPVRAHVTNPVVERLLRRMGLKRSEVILRTAA